MEQQFSPRFPSHEQGNKCSIYSFMHAFIHSFWETARQIRRLAGSEFFFSAVVMASGHNRASVKIIHS